MKIGKLISQSGKITALTVIIGGVASLAFIAMTSPASGQTGVVTKSLTLDTNGVVTKPANFWITNVGGITNAVGAHFATSGQGALASTALQPGTAITNISGLQTALDLKQSLSEKNQPNGYVGLDNEGKMPATQFPDEISARISVLTGTAAGLSSQPLALGELAAPTDANYLLRGTGVGNGGVKIGDNSLCVQNSGGVGAAGTNLGGAGAPGSAGASSTPSVAIAGGNGGNNAASGTGAGGNASVIVSPLVILKLTGGNGGAASGNFAGGNASSVSPTSIVELNPGSGGSASSGAAGRDGGVLLSAPVVRATSGSAGAGSSGTGRGGAGGGILGNTGSPGIVKIIAGTGGAASGNSNGGAGGNVLVSSGNAALFLLAGNGGAAGAGGNGGAGGSVNGSLVKLSGGNGGAGSAASAGGNSGSINGSVISVATGSGGDAGSGANENGGAGGSGGSLTITGGNGGIGSGGVAGGAGGAGGSITLNGSSASGTTAGAAGGLINLSAIGTSAAPNILNGNGSPESVVSAPKGSLFLRMDGGANTTLYVKESGTGNTGWVAK